MDDNRYGFIPGKRRTTGILLCSGLLAIAAWGLNVVNHEQAPPNAQSLLHRSTRVDYRPVRGDFRPLRLRKIGFEYKCNECHRSINTPSKTIVAEHTEIRLDHGRNNVCLNCHHPTNREAYVDHDGSEISADQPAKLCGKCHGIVHRDWQVGAHGKLTGYWDRSKGEQKRLLCIQCHDPHAPKFQPLPPMPGPSRGTSIDQGGHHG